MIMCPSGAMCITPSIQLGDSYTDKTHRYIVIPNEQEYIVKPVVCDLPQEH
jgi:hypothetical protein